MPSAEANQARVNELGQPIGPAMDNWTPPPPPPHSTLSGNYCRIEPLQADRHAQQFWDAIADDPSDARWTYLTVGPFANFATFEKWCLGAQDSHDPQYYAIVVDGFTVGMISYMRIKPSRGVVEVGHVHFSPRLAKSCAAAETIYLLAENVFRLGYRRFEWKCDSLNLPSRAAAPRFGFTYEGKFRQAVVYKGRSRDSTWFSMIDADWDDGIKDAYRRWLDPDNFDEKGLQKLKLSELTAPFVHARS